MKIAVCFLAIVFSATALPVEDLHERVDKLDLSKLTPNNIYVEPINPVIKSANLPGSRIVGGSEVTPNSAPYQAALIINGINLCGGSLISTTSVLSAAHCTISASYVEIRLGAHYYGENEDTQVRITSTNIINHWNYNPTNLQNDISLVLLPTAVTLNNNIATIPLAATTAGTFEGSTALVTGWGLTSETSTSASPVLFGVNVTIININACRNIYGSLITAAMVCTSGIGPVGVCTGDSGGPLVVDGVQIGVVSFSSARCEAENPSGYTRISIFRSWIEENAGV